MVAIRVVGDRNNLDRDARHERRALESVFGAAPKTGRGGDVVGFVELRHIDLVRAAVDGFLGANDLASIVVPAH